MFLLLLLLLAFPSPLSAALGTNALTNGVDSGCTLASPPSSVSFTPSANTLVLACFTQTIATAPIGTVTMPASHGLTWVEVDTQVSGSTSQQRTTLFRGMTASPTSGNASWTISADQLRCGWAIAEISGVSTSGTNGSGAIVQVAKNTGTASITVTLPNAFGTTTNLAVGCIGSQSNQNLVPSGGFVEIGTQVGGQAVRTINQSAVNISLVTAAPATGSTNISGIAIEIGDPTGTAATMRRRPPPRHYMSVHPPLVASVEPWGVLDYFLAHLFIPAYPGGAYVAG